MKVSEVMARDVESLDLQSSIGALAARRIRVDGVVVPRECIYSFIEELGELASLLTDRPDVMERRDACESFEVLASIALQGIAWLRHEERRERSQAEGGFCE